MLSVNKLYSELLYIESCINNTTEAMTENITDARRRELSYKLDNLCSKRDYITAQLETETETQTPDSQGWGRLKAFIIYCIIIIACFYFYLSLVIS